MAGEAAAFAVVGFGEVNQLEVKGEGAGELVSGGFVEGLDAFERVLERVGRSRGARLGAAGGSGGVNLAAGDGGLAKLFDGFEDGHASLLAQDLAEQHAERANVAAQRRFLELAGGRLQLSQALRPV